MLVDALGPWAITLEAQVQNLGLLHLVRGGGSPLNRRAQKSRARSTEPTKKNAIIGHELHQKSSEPNEEKPFDHPSLRSSAC
jgi:hypothetical protein